MQKYWGKIFSASGVWGEVGQKQKTEQKKKKRLNDGNNNGQLRIANATSAGARKAAWANLLITQMARLITPNNISSIQFAPLTILIYHIKFNILQGILMCLSNLLW